MLQPGADHPFPLFLECLSFTNVRNGIMAAARASCVVAWKSLKERRGICCELFLLNGSQLSAQHLVVTVEIAHVCVNLCLSDRHTHNPVGETVALLLVWENRAESNHQ